MIRQIEERRAQLGQLVVTFCFFRQNNILQMRGRRIQCALTNSSISVSKPTTKSDSSVEFYSLFRRSERAGRHLLLCRRTTLSTSVAPLVEPSPCETWSAIPDRRSIIEHPPSCYRLTSELLKVSSPSINDFTAGEMVLPTSSATTFVSHSSKPSLVASCSNCGFPLTEHLLETLV